MGESTSRYKQDYLREENLTIFRRVVGLIEIALMKHNKFVGGGGHIKASISNDHFTSVFAYELPGEVPTKGVSPHSAVPDINITASGVLKLLRNINPTKATGPDTIPGRILKELATEITPALTLIFKASLHQGEIPEQWKKACVTPLFKKGDIEKAANYRPVSLTSISCKIMEHIMHSNIISHLEANSILSNYQHGFRKERSRECQLLLTIQDLADGAKGNRYANPTIYVVTSWRKWNR